MTIVTIIDCFIDEPACLGVPPFISPQVRAIVGATRDAGSEANYITIDQIRNGSPSQGLTSMLLWLAPPYLVNISGPLQPLDLRSNA